MGAAGWQFGMLITGGATVMLFYVTVIADLSTPRGADIVSRTRSLADILSGNYFQFSKLSLIDFQRGVLLIKILIPALLVHFIEAVMVYQRARSKKWYYFARTCLCGFTSWCSMNVEQEKAAKSKE